MKRKKLLALTLAGVITAATLTACTPLDAAELVYDSIFGGGSSSTGSGNNGSTGGNTGGSTAEEAVNSAVAEAYVQSLIDNSETRRNYENIVPAYDIPNLEVFVQKIDEYCTKKSEINRTSWEDTVHELTMEELSRLAEVLDERTYGNSRAALRFWKDPSGTPQQQVQQMNSYARLCNPFWYTAQQTPYKGNAWFDSVVLTRTDGTKYRFLLSICRG